ncbi:YraN family protein [Adlercreutzia muris]|uniref:UPF0102 protein F8D48_03470 n=1 Tax=Adlercreutzia muris TaxID=1796610 RepID=A0A7C8FPU4_9ACTN|nr:YraN family protein [Adlercreutzia muris]KAB1650975.1 YraN family protein [Adlercreutzia muris]
MVTIEEAAVGRAAAPAKKRRQAKDAPIGKHAAPTEGDNKPRKRKSSSRKASPGVVGTAARRSSKGKTAVGGSAPATVREPRGRRNRALGARGEDAAVRFLEARGYHILERNWTCFAGEADIIAADGTTLVFVEVKTRRDDSHGLPSEAVGRAKRERYEKIALAYVTDHFFDEAVVRFDVVAITVLPEDRAFVSHHVGAYSAG